MGGEKEERGEEYDKEKKKECGRRGWEIGIERKKGKINKEEE